MPNYKVLADGRKDLAAYPEQVREVAFELWWLECGRNGDEVAGRFVNDPVVREQAGLADGDIGPSGDTIRRWARNGEWADEAHRRMRQMAPHMLERGAVSLVYAFPEAVQTLTRVAAGHGSNEKGKPDSSDRIAADNAFRVVQLIAGDQLSALAKPVVDAAVDLSKLDGMTIDEILEAERSLPGSTG